MNARVKYEHGGKGRISESSWDMMVWVLLLQRAILPLFFMCIVWLKNRIKLTSRTDFSIVRAIL